MYLFIVLCLLKKWIFHKRKWIQTIIWRLDMTMKIHNMSTMFASIIYDIYLYTYLTFHDLIYNFHFVLWIYLESNFEDLYGLHLVQYFDVLVMVLTIKLWKGKLNLVSWSSYREYFIKSVIKHLDSAKKSFLGINR